VNTKQLHMSDCSTIYNLENYQILKNYIVHKKMPIRFNQKKRNSYQTQICIQAQYNIHYN